MPGGIYPPLSVIAHWPAPNHVDPETRPAVVPPVAALLNIFLLVISGIRMWMRYKVPASAGMDDIFFAVAAPVIFAMTIVVPLATDVHGFNHHVWDNTIATDVTGRKYVLVIMTLFSFASGALKISILLFYRRLSQRLVSPVFKWALWITIGSVVGVTIPYTLKPLWACQPISAFWDSVDVIKVFKGYKFRCFNEGADIVTASAISAVQDLFTALLPNILLWRLQVNTKQKLMLVSLFSVAYCAAAMGFLRLGFSYRVYFTSYDVTWQAWTSWLLSMLELHLAAFCACAPTLKAFFARYGIFDYLWRLSAVEISKRSKKQTDQSSRSQRSQDKGQVDGEFPLCDVSEPSISETEKIPSEVRRAHYKFPPAHGSWLNPGRTSGDTDELPVMLHSPDPQRYMDPKFSAAVYKEMV